MKRFYKEVTTQQSEAGWQILLDDKPVRTPHKHALAMPTQALADLVRAEWDAVKESINPKAMPHTGLAHAAIDAMPSERAHVVKDLCAFGDTDLLYYRAPEEALATKQKALWDPVLRWAEGRYGGVFSLAEGIMPVAQEAQTLNALRADVETLDDWQLAGFTIWVHKLGSLLLALGLRHGNLGVAQAVSCAQLDEAHQASTWGEDAEAIALRQAIHDEIETAHVFFTKSVD